jgi:acid stress chaperone HdeA
MRASWWTSSSMLLVPLIVTAATTATLAAEFQKPVTRWTCAEFLSVDDEFKPAVVSWATTFARGGQPEAAAIDVQGIERVTTQIIGECTNAPAASFWSSLKTSGRRSRPKTEVE